MMLLVLLLICCCTIVKFKETTLICSTSLLLLPHFSAGIGNVKLLYIVSIFQCLMFYMKGFWKKEGNPYPKWIAWICVLTSCCYLYSTWRGTMGSYIPTVMVNICCYFWYPYIIWKLIRTRSDVVFVLRSLFVFFLIVGGYALVELAMGQNYYSLFVNNMGWTAGILGGETAGERFDLLRCNSILPYSSALGMTAGTVFMILLYLRVNGLYIIAKQKEMFLLMVLPFCVLLSGTRSQYIFTALCVFPFLFYGKFFKSRISKTILAIVFIVLIISGEYFFTIVDSIVHSDKSNIGSSSDMRQNQFDICMKYFIFSPLWGWGKNYIWDYVKAENWGLLGAESVWFQLMVDYGIMGMITYLLICISCAILLAKKSKVLAFFPIAFLVGKTLSIVIGIELSYLLIITFILYKAETLLIERK